MSTSKLSKKMAYDMVSKSQAKTNFIKCPGCSNPARIHPQYGVISCEECAAKPSYKGTPLNFTEGSERIRKQREQFHDDYLQPHVYNKSSKNLEINEEFVNRYPEKSHLYFTEQEMRKAGYSKLARYSEDVKRNESKLKEKRDEFKQRVIESHIDPERNKAFLESLVR